VTVTVPPVVEHLLTADVVVEIAEVFTDSLVYRSGSCLTTTQE
jgi:hypothetical protein